MILFKNISQILFKPISGQYYTHIETSQLICSANQLTGFYERVTLSWCGLKIVWQDMQKKILNKIVVSIVL